MIDIFVYVREKRARDKASCRILVPSFRSLR